MAATALSTRGRQAAVLATTEEKGSLTALSIHIVPGKPIHMHHVGVATEYTEGVSLTIEARDGDLIAFLFGADFKILPEERADELAVGRRVTIIARRDPTGGDLTAQGVVIHPELTGIDTVETETPEPTDTAEVTETATLIPSGQSLSLGRNELVKRETARPGQGLAVCVRAHGPTQSTPCLRASRGRAASRRVVHLHLHVEIDLVRYNRAHSGRGVARRGGARSGRVWP